MQIACGSVSVTADRNFLVESASSINGCAKSKFGWFFSSTARSA